MSILTKVLIGLVVVAVFPLLYFATAALKVQQIWRTQVGEFEKAVAQEQEANFIQLHGDAVARAERYSPEKLPNGRPGIVQLEIARDNLMLGRGRFWYAERVPNSIDAQTGKFKILIKDDNVHGAAREDDPNHGIKDKSFVYVFQISHLGEPAAGDRYVGEFIVDGLALDANGVPTDANVPLRPTTSYGDAQWAVLSAGSDKWVVYEHMPIDDHKVFGNLTAEQIRERLPPEVAAEYVNDDKPPSEEVLKDERLSKFIAEDPATGVKKFLRPLRDYQQIFRNVALRSAAIDDRLAVLKKEKVFADQAKIQAEALIAALDVRQAKLEEEMKLLDRELAVVRAHRDKLTELVAKVEQDLQTQLSENRRMADEMAGRGKTAALFEPTGAAARTP